MDLRPLISEGRSLLGESTANGLPRAIHAILAMLVKDAKAKEKIVGSAEYAMTRYLDHARRPPEIPKRRGKKGAPVPEVPMVPTRDMASVELVSQALTWLDTNSLGESALQGALNLVKYEEAFESYVLRQINRAVHTPEGIGPWMMHSEWEAGEMRLSYRFAGPELGEVDGMTEHPGETYEQDINNVLRGTLGASRASTDWSTELSPRSWDRGEAPLVAYEGTAVWNFSEAQALRTALGEPELLQIAARVLAAARDE